MAMASTSSRALGPPKITPDVQRVLERVGSTLLQKIRICGGQDEWVRFEVPGMLDHNVMIQIEAKKGAILGSDEATVQIVCEQAALGAGLWIRTLISWYGERTGYSGAWFY